MQNTTKYLVRNIEQATEKSKKEIAEALCPTNFILQIETPSGREYCEPYDTRKENIYEILTSNRQISVNFRIINKSKYPAKDTTLFIYLDNNTINYKKGEQSLVQCLKRYTVSRVFEISPWNIEDFIAQGSKGMGTIFLPTIHKFLASDFELSPIYMFKDKDEAKIVLLINKSQFRIRYILQPKKEQKL